MSTTTCPGPANPGMTTNNTIFPVLTVGVQWVIAITFTHISLQLWPSYAYHMGTNEDKKPWYKCAPKTVIQLFAFLISVGVAILIPLLSVGGYGIMMNSTSFFAACSTLKGIVFPNDFINIYHICNGVLFYILLYTYAFISVEKEDILRRIYAVANLTLIWTALIDAIGAGSFDIGPQRTVPFGISFTCLLLAFLQFLTQMMNVYIGYKAKPAESNADYDKIDAYGKQNNIVNMYSFGVSPLVGPLKFYDMIGINIGYIQPLARTASLTFTQLVRFNDVIKTISAFFSIQFTALIYSAIFGQQFYLPVEGSQNMFMYSESFFAATFIQNGTYTVISQQPFINTNMFTILPAYKLGFTWNYDNLPGLYIVLGAVALFLNFMCLLGTSAKLVIAQDRTYSSSLLAKEIN